jgi:hypothetical protein
LTEAAVEWLFPSYWVAAFDPMTWWAACDPPPTAEVRDGPDLDLDVVRVVYAVLLEGVACCRCGADLEPPADVERIRGFFSGARIVVATRCRGPRRHRHLAQVTERGGDLRLGQLRAA